MTGSCWRLLVCLSSIFLLSILLSPPLRAQAVGEDRFPAFAPIFADSPDAPRFSPVRLPVPIAGPWRAPIAPAPIGLPQITAAAGIIFSGRVTFVGRAGGVLPAASGQNTASTVVTFQVEHALRGTKAGEHLTIREWAGLWNGKEHYRVGERVLLFLYPPSKLGSPVPWPGPWADLPSTLGEGLC